MLKTKEALTPNQVDAAAKVVAASLGIPERITIVDHKLNPLSRDYNQTDILKRAVRMKCAVKDSLNLKIKCMTCLKSVLHRMSILIPLVFQLMRFWILIH